MNSIGKHLLSRAAAICLAAVLISFCFCGHMEVQAASSTNAVVSANGGNIFIRSGPSTSYRAVAVLKDKTTLFVTGSSGNWYKIELRSGLTGYASKRYIALKSSSGGNANTGSSSSKKDTVSSGSSSSAVTYPVTAKVSAGGTVPLKLRKQATTASAILKKIPRGSSITITGKYNAKWYTAKYDGASGYVSAAYIVMPKQNSSTASTGSSSTKPSAKPAQTTKPARPTSYTKIQLKNVPDYAQADSRWASIHLGKSSSTIGRSGCTLCCVAELESYYAKKKITPAEMVKKVSFSDGYLYWPSGYIQNYSTNYLTEIYYQLYQGNPVMVGAKSPSGRQHWVVVTGYTKNTGTKLSAANFTINDPLQKHNNLQEFFNKYSRFYKLVYK